MDIPPSDPAARLQSALPVAASPRLAVPIEALVQAMAPVDARRPEAGYAVRLSVPGSDQPIEATSPRPLSPGTRITLRLDAPDSARVLSTQPPTTAAEGLALQALRNDLPRQQPIAEALAAIFRIATAQPLPAPLAPALAALQRAVPRAPELAEPATLARAIANSGSLFEPRLAAFSRVPLPRPDSPGSPIPPVPAAPDGRPPARAAERRGVPAAEPARRPRAATGASSLAETEPPPAPALAPTGSALRAAWEGLRRLVSGELPTPADADPEAAPTPGRTVAPRAERVPTPAAPLAPRPPPADGNTGGARITPAHDGSLRPHPSPSGLPLALSAEIDLADRPTAQVPAVSEAPTPVAPPRPLARFYIPAQAEPASRAEASAEASTAAGTPRPSAVSLDNPGAPGIPEPPRSDPAADPAADEGGSPPPPRSGGARPDAPPPAAGGIPPTAADTAPRPLSGTHARSVAVTADDAIPRIALPFTPPASREPLPAAPSTADGAAPPMTTAGPRLPPGLPTRAVAPEAEPGAPRRTDTPAIAAVDDAQGGEDPTRSPLRREPAPTTDPPARPESMPGALPALLRDDLKARLLVLREVLATLGPLLPGTAASATRPGAPAAAVDAGEDAPLLLYGPRGLPAGIAAPDDPQGTARGSRRRGASPAMAEDDTIVQLLRYVEGALARTRVQQLARLPETRAGQEAQPPALWIAEVPFQGPRGLETLHLRLEQETAPRRAQAAERSDWRVLLRLDMGETGPLHALVRLCGKRVGATLWAERAATFRVAREGLAELESLLRQQGVEVAQLECHRGSPPESIIPACGPLLDVRT